MGGHHTNGPAAVAPPAEPRLPQELERVVFEMAARDDMRGRVLLRLMSVARRAREWLQPLLYETIILGYADFYHKSNSPLHRPPRFPTGAQRAHVRNLFVSDLSHRAKTEPHWPDLLPHCPNLEHLVFWFESIPGDTALDLVTASLRSPLRSPSSSPGLLRLIAPLASLFPDGRVDFHHEIFRHLTHLGVFDFSSEGGIRWEEGNNYGCIPRLRCLYIVTFASTPTYPRVVLRRCLQECRRLEVLVISLGDIDSSDDEEMAQESVGVVGADGTVDGVPEDRLVVYRDLFRPGETWTENWYRGTVGGDDVWVQAERIVERRRRREAKRRLWSEAADWDEDVDLGAWLSAMETR